MLPPGGAAGRLAILRTSSTGICSKCSFVLSITCSLVSDPSSLRSLRVISLRNDFASLVGYFSVANG
jgi:hypothetical protein